MNDSTGLQVDDLSVEFGAVTALNHVSCEFPASGISGLLGPNGAGKTTLLNVVSGFQVPSSGSVRVNGSDLAADGIRARVLSGVVRTFQTVRLLEKETVFDNVALGCEGLQRHSPLRQVLGIGKGRAARRRDHDVTIDALAMVGLGSLAQRMPAELPYAKRRLVEIARAIAGSPKVLLLDEPMAGMDREARLALLDTLVEVQGSLGMTMVVVEHDIDMVRRLCTHVVVLAGGAFVAAGPPDEIVADPRVQATYFGAEDARHQ
ncbi:ABC transporter ATP-binding protein [Dactylosporangium maewongense]|uniref:ABC transporter ATP-binding protein n=1 Tax=Dactylosporangium maewongense TaxID=634393 RepID=A0ABP4PGW7_9ACTN